MEQINILPVYRGEENSDGDKRSRRRKCKKEICDTVLHRLSEWFGIEESIAEYVSQVEEMPFYGVYDGERPVGFLAVKIHNAFTAEVCVMGILKEYHRMGIGSELMERVERVLSTEGIGLSYGKNTGWFCGF